MLFLFTYIFSVHQDWVIVVWRQLNSAKNVLWRSDYANLLLMRGGELQGAHIGIAYKYISNSNISILLFSGENLEWKAWFQLPAHLKLKFSSCNKLKPIQNWRVIISEDREKGAFHFKMSIGFFFIEQNMYIVDNTENYKRESKNI